MWVLDPLDGTKSFIDGSPDFATMVALIEERDAGVLDLAPDPRSHVHRRSRKGSFETVNSIPPLLTTR